MNDKRIDLHVHSNCSDGRLSPSELVAYAAEKGLTLAGQPFELYAIDNRDTVRPEEFLTEIQVLLG